MFPIKMAWRETRAAWRHFLYFFACIAVGVGGVVGVSLFASNVERAVSREARGLLGGDVEIRLSHPVSTDGAEVLQSLEERGVIVRHVSELVAMATAIHPDDRRPPSTTQLIELKAVESGYPLYGKLVVEPGSPLQHLIDPIRRPDCDPVCYGAVVHESLLIRMGLAHGDRIKIGDAVFTITAVIRKEPDRTANMFSLGPRVMISQEGLAAAGLVKPGSRVRERYLLKVSGAVALEPLLYELRGRLTHDSARISLYRDAQPQLKRFLNQLAQYLGLVGLTALFVGGVGVAASVQAFIREKFLSIATLKMLGAETSTIIHTYLGQALGLGMLGSAAGVGVGIVLQSIFPSAVSRLIDPDLLNQLAFSSALEAGSLVPILKGTGLGLLTTLLFSVWPLLTIRSIRPAGLLRRDVDVTEASVSHGVMFRWKFWILSLLRDRPRLIAATGIAAGLTGLSMWQAGSLKVGTLFMGGLVLAVLLLALSAEVLLIVLRVIPIPQAISLRQAVRNIIRPGSQAVSVMMSIGVGVMVIMTVGLLEDAFIQQVSENRPSDAPTFFFIDIQPDQADAFAHLLHEKTGDPSPKLTPLVRSRLHGIDGDIVKAEAEEEKSSQVQRDDKRKGWYLTREYVLTFLDHLPKDNILVQGEWWQPGQHFPRPLVSVEEEAAKNLGLKIGSTVDLDIQGSILSATVSSIRRVDWGNFSTNFYMIVSPGALEGAPVTYVATVRVPLSEEVSLQQAVVAAFPNVTALNVGDVLDSFTRVLDRLGLAVRAVALFCILAGALVMATALTATRYRRLYESVVLKALGATRGVIARSFAAEYVMMGAIAGIIGMVLASALSWAVLYFILELPWSIRPGILATGLVMTVTLTVSVGFLSTFRILGQRPLAVLRQE
ncbi:MAG TPA: FtsX-like permease family protein [Nitrospiraceae bacterium]|nr:FtsX-like permease family protein [Nitrospiraceae bacterium]